MNVNCISILVIYCMVHTSGFSEDSENRRASWINRYSPDAIVSITSLLSPTSGFTNLSNTVLSVLWPSSDATSPNNNSVKMLSRLYTCFISDNATCHNATRLNHWLSYTLVQHIDLFKQILFVTASQLVGCHYNNQRLHNMWISDLAISLDLLTTRGWIIKYRVAECYHSLFLFLHSFFLHFTTFPFPNPNPFPWPSSGLLWLGVWEVFKIWNSSLLKKLSTMFSLNLTPTYSKCTTLRAGN